MVIHDDACLCMVMPEYSPDLKKHDRVWSDMRVLTHAWSCFFTYGEYSGIVMHDINTWSRMIMYDDFFLIFTVY